MSTTPAPGSDLVADPARSGQTDFKATFAVTFETAIASATLELSMLDGNNQICGSGASDPQNLAAGQATSFTVAITALTCTLPAAVENLKATLVSGAAPQRTEYINSTVAAHYVVKPPSVAANTLSGLVTEPGHGPIGGARIDVEDGPNAGKSTMTDAVGRYTLTGLTPGTFTVRASKDGYENSHIRVTLGASGATQDFAIGRVTNPPPPSAGVISFLGSTPAPGGETVLTESAGSIYLRDFRVHLGVRFDTTLPDAKIELKLSTDAGQLCSYAFIDRPIVANESITVTVDTVWVWETQTCNVFPVGTASLKVTLLTLREPTQNGRLQRTDWATETFPVRYTIRRYPLPPGGPPTLPTISALSWQVDLPVGGDPPIPGDPVIIACTARESDGAPLTTTITLTWDGVAPLRYSRFFPAGASSSPAGAYHSIYVSAPTVGYQHARIDCVSTNDRGESATRSTDIGTPR